MPTTLHVHPAIQPSTMQPAPPSTFWKAPTFHLPSSLIIPLPCIHLSACLSISNQLTSRYERSCITSSMALTLWFCSNRSRWVLPSSYNSRTMARSRRSTSSNAAAQQQNSLLAFGAVYFNQKCGLSPAPIRLCFVEWELRYAAGLQRVVAPSTAYNRGETTSRQALHHEALQFGR